MWFQYSSLTCCTPVKSKKSVKLSWVRDHPASNTTYIQAAIRISSGYTAVLKSVPSRRMSVRLLGVERWSTSFLYMSFWNRFLLSLSFFRLLRTFYGSNSWSCELIESLLCWRVLVLFVLVAYLPCFYVRYSVLLFLESILSAWTIKTCIFSLIKKGLSNVTLSFVFSSKFSILFLNLLEESALQVYSSSLFTASLCC
jgi:hypothetical protein